MDYKRRSILYAVLSFVGLALFNAPFLRDMMDSIESPVHEYYFLMSAWAFFILFIFIVAVGLNKATKQESADE